MLSFAPADVTRPAEVSQLIGGDHPDTLVYLALPPGLLPSVLPALAAAGLRAADAVAIEKPFGTDLASARHLNEILRIQLPQPTIFRIDHFLSNELVRRVITLRFLNRVFEPVWNAVHVDQVDISWLESLTLEGRASYYDQRRRTQGHGAKPSHGSHGAGPHGTASPHRRRFIPRGPCRGPAGSGHPGGGDDAQRTRCAPGTPPAR